MFRITNTNTKQQETCSNRDELLSMINEKSVWIQDRGEKQTLFLEQLSEEGSVLDTKDLTLPLREIVESELASFGLKKDKKGFGLKSKNKSLKNDQEQPSKRNVIDRETRDRDSLMSRIFKTLTFFLALIALIISFYSNTILKKQLNEINNRISLQENQSKIDVVGRFFIANYFSGENSRLTDFLSSDLKAEGLDAKSDQQLQSAIFESSNVSGKLINITYVVSTKIDTQIKTFRLTLSFEKDKDSTYGYVLKNKPKYSSFIK